MDGVLTDSNPNGLNLGWGLTGSGNGNLRFDLSGYAGRSIKLRFNYQTDLTVINPGWWVDNLLLADANGTLYENDLDSDFSDWTLDRSEEHTSELQSRQRPVAERRLQHRVRHQRRTAAGGELGVVGVVQDRKSTRAM